MAKHRIFPTKLAELFAYINLVIPYLLDLANRARLGLTGVTELDDADTIRTTIYNPKYLAAANPSTNTKPVRDTRASSSKDIVRLVRFSYGEIPQSALKDDDRNLLNLKKRDTVKSKRKKMTTTPYCKFVNLGGGRLRELARTDSDASRPSIHVDADGIETFYTIVPVDAAAPASPAACPLQKFSTEARFDIECGVENLGKRVYGFSRWVNTSKPENNSPFSDVFTTVIGGSSES